jgi:hypothetical protein
VRLQLVTMVAFVSTVPAAHAAAPVSETVAACRAEPDGARRLACYDQEIDRLTGARAAPEPVPPPMTFSKPAAAAPDLPATPSAPGAAVPTSAQDAKNLESRLSAEQRFGLNAAQVAARDPASAGPAPLDVLLAKVVALRALPQGGVLIDLDNGQRWQQTGLELDLLLRVGAAVKIRRASFGSFMLSTTTGRMARVKRLS